MSITCNLKINGNNVRAGGFSSDQSYAQLTHIISPLDMLDFTETTFTNNRNSDTYWGIGVSFKDNITNAWSNYTSLISVPTSQCNLVPSSQTKSIINLTYFPSNRWPDGKTATSDTWYKFNMENATYTLNPLTGDWEWDELPCSTLIKAVVATATKPNTKYSGFSNAYMSIDSYKYYKPTGTYVKNYLDFKLRIYQGIGPNYYAVTIYESIELNFRLYFNPIKPSSGIKTFLSYSPSFMIDTATTNNYAVEITNDRYWTSNSQYVYIAPSGGSDSQNIISANYLDSNTYDTKFTDIRIDLYDELDKMKSYTINKNDNYRLEPNGILKFRTTLVYASKGYNEIYRTSGNIYTYYPRTNLDIESFRVFADNVCINDTTPALDVGFLSNLNFYITNKYGNPKYPNLESFKIQLTLKTYNTDNTLDKELSFTGTVDNSSSDATLPFKNFKYFNPNTLKYETYESIPLKDLIGFDYINTYKLFQIKFDMEYSEYNYYLNLTPKFSEQINTKLYFRPNVDLRDILISFLDKSNNTISSQNLITTISSSDSYDGLESKVYNLNNVKYLDISWTADRKSIASGNLSGFMLTINNLTNETVNTDTGIRARVHSNTKYYIYPGNTSLGTNNGFDSVIFYDRSLRELSSSTITDKDAISGGYVITPTDAYFMKVTYKVDIPGIYISEVPPIYVSLNDPNLTEAVIPIYENTYRYRYKYYISDINAIRGLVNYAYSVTPYTEFYIEQPVDVFDPSFPKTIVNNTVNSNFVTLEDLTKADSKLTIIGHAGAAIPETQIGWIVRHDSTGTDVWYKAPNTNNYLDYQINYVTPYEGPQNYGRYYCVKPGDVFFITGAYKIKTYYGGVKPTIDSNSFYYYDAPNCVELNSSTYYPYSGNRPIPTFVKIPDNNYILYVEYDIDDYGFMVFKSYGDNPNPDPNNSQKYYSLKMYHMSDSDMYYTFNSCRCAILKTGVYSYTNMAGPNKSNNISVSNCNIVYSDYTTDNTYTYYRPVSQTDEYMLVITRNIASSKCYKSSNGTVILTSDNTISTNDMYRYVHPLIYDFKYPIVDTELRYFSVYALSKLIAILTYPDDPDYNQLLYIYGGYYDYHYGDSEITSELSNNITYTFNDAYKNKDYLFVDMDITEDYEINTPYSIHVNIVKNIVDLNSDFSPPEQITTITFDNPVSINMIINDEFKLRAIQNKIIYGSENDTECISHLIVESLKNYAALYGMNYVNLYNLLDSEEIRNSKITLEYFETVLEHMLFINKKINTYRSSDDICLPYLEYTCIDSRNQKPTVDNMDNDYIYYKKLGNISLLDSTYEYIIDSGGGVTDDTELFRDSLTFTSEVPGLQIENVSLDKGDDITESQVVTRNLVGSTHSRVIFNPDTSTNFSITPSVSTSYIISFYNKQGVLLASMQTATAITKDNVTSSTLYLLKSTYFISLSSINSNLSYTISYTPRLRYRNLINDLMTLMKNLIH
jgi:hypothetical protein